MGENSECSPGRLCFQVETCAEADPIYDDSFCGEHYLDAQTNCNARCPRGKDLECPEGNKCFSVEQCLSDPVPLPPQRPWGAPRPSMSAAPERAMAAAAPEPAPPPSPSESPNSSGPSAAMLIGITAAILVAIIAIFAVVALYIWRRRSMRRGSQRKQDQQVRRLHACRCMGLSASPLRASQLRTPPQTSHLFPVHVGHALAHNIIYIYNYLHWDTTSFTCIHNRIQVSHVRSRCGPGSYAQHWRQHACRAAARMPPPDRSAPTVSDRCSVACQPPSASLSAAWSKRLRFASFSEAARKAWRCASTPP